MRRLAESLLSRIEDPLERGRDARSRLLENPTLKWVDASLLEEIHEILGETVALLSEAEAGFSADASDLPAGGAARISDLAWLSRGEVAQHLESLRSSESKNVPWKVVGESDSALERADRALLALESSLREVLGLPPTERSRRRLRESLEVRRLYIAVRRSMLQTRGPNEGALLDELWALSQQLHAIRTVEAYAVIRVEDRRQLQSLLDRIDTALGDPSPESELERKRLWQDLEAFSQLLMAIHDRDDLRSHDLASVREARRRLDGSPATVEDVLHDLRWMLGREEELDRYLLGKPATTAALEDILERLEDELRKRTGG